MTVERLAQNWEKVGDDKWRNKKEFNYMDGIHLTLVHTEVVRSGKEALELEAKRPVESTTTEF